VKTAHDTASAAFDHHSTAFAANPYPIWTVLRTTEGPVSWSDAWGGFWVITGHQECQQVMKDWETFSSADGIHIPRIPGVKHQVPIETDPPEYFVIKKVLAPWFSARAINQYEDDIRQLVDELLDQVIEAGSADAINDFAGPLPARFILRMLGFDESHWFPFREGAQAALGYAAPEVVKEKVGWIYQMVGDAIRSRRTDRAGREDIICRLLDTHFEGIEVNDELVTDILILLLIAGLDTTTSLISHLMFSLTKEPGLRAGLIADPGLIPAAVEESLRHDAVVQTIARRAKRDTEVAGTKISKGDMVLVGFASASRDPSVFPDPDDFRVDRTNQSQNMGFGAGIHKCIGAPLARLETRIAIEQLLKRMPDVRVPDGVTPQRYPDSAQVYQFRSLPIEFTPGRRHGAASS
jgi:cytochrome P450